MCDKKLTQTHLLLAFLVNLPQFNPAAPVCSSSRVVGSDLDKVSKHTSHDDCNPINCERFQIHLNPERSLGRKTFRM